MGYKILGFAVWHGGKWYVKRRLGVLFSRKAVAAGVVGVAVVAIAANGARRSSS